MNFTPSRAVPLNPAPVPELASASQSLAAAGPGDGGAGPPRAVLRDSGAFSGQPGDLPPDVAMLRAVMLRMEEAWLANLSTAPHDDQAVALLQAGTWTPEAAAAAMDGRDPRFIRAILLRGAARLWADGPASKTQRA